MPSLTINFTAAQAARISAAFQEALGLDSPATVTDMKQYIINDLRQVVKHVLSERS